MTVRFAHLRPLAAAVAFAAAAPLAGAAEAPSRPDPLDARAAVPKALHRSPFAGYRGLADEKPLGWKEANDTVGRIGGWRSYAREVESEAEPADKAAPHRH